MVLEGHGLIMARKTISGNQFAFIEDISILDCILIADKAKKHHIASIK